MADEISGLIMQTHSSFKIREQSLGVGQPTFIIAELSANHGQKLDGAMQLVEAAHAAGADAVKLQTYTADTLTIDCDTEHFRIQPGSTWQGRNMYELYQEAHTPWEWHKPLFQKIEDLGMIAFSSAFDPTSVDFLESLNIPCYKVASFELVDIPLLEKIAQTGKPVIMSTGMASFREIAVAVETIRKTAGNSICLLKCTSAYPASASDMNLKTIPHLSASFQVPVGLSDHSLDVEIPIAAVCLGACVIEKHLTLSGDVNGPDSSFSLEPDEFEDMVRRVRNAEQSLGKVVYGGSESETSNKLFRKSLFAVKNIKHGETLSSENVRSIRPGAGLPPEYFNIIIGKKARKDIKRGTPMDWNMIAE